MNFFIDDKEENRRLTKDFWERVRQIREKKTQELFDKLYIPIAIEIILKRDNYLTAGQEAKDLALKLFICDCMQGVYDELYNLKGQENGTK